MRVAKDATCFVLLVYTLHQTNCRNFVELRGLHGECFSREMHVVIDRFRPSWLFGHFFMLPHPYCISFFQQQYATGIRCTWYTI